jgi:hypothetical protein
MKGLPRGEESSRGRIFYLGWKGTASKSLTRGARGYTEEERGKTCFYLCVGAVSDIVRG